MSSLTERWQSQPIPNLRKWLLEKNSESPFGITEDELHDFRGILIQGSLHQIEIEKIDFSEASMKVAQFAATVRGCCFVKCNFDGSMGNKFVDCNFQQAKVSDCGFYGRFFNCSFLKARLINVRGSELKFEECDFTGANLRKSSYYDSTFLRCKFVNCKLGMGSFAGSKFEDCEIEGVDFSKTVMNRVKGIELDEG